MLSIFKSENNKNNKGFTLVELMAILIIMVLVVTIVVTRAINIIKSSKEKSYNVTVKNIENVASGYATENYMKHVWIDSELDNNKQYFCVSVGDLIDTGFLKNDVLDSYIAQDQLVSKENYIYLERNKTTKTVVRNLLINYYDEKYEDYCSDYNTGVDIEFIEEPTGWAREKKVKINYRIFNLKNIISDYKYKYYFDSSKNKDWEVFDNFLENDEINNITSNGVVKAYVKSTDLNVVKEYTIDKIDRVAPKIELTLDNKSVEESKILGKTYAKSRNVSISLVDNGSGLKKGSYVIKYEWSLNSKTCNELANSVVIDVSDNGVKKVSKNINISNNTGIGKLYVCGENITDIVTNVRDNKIEIIDMYLDNIKPVISIGNYSGNQVVFKEVIIPIIVNDVDSGIKKDSFTSTDIELMIGEKVVKDGFTLSKIDEKNYNLKIVNSELNGKVTLKINNDNIFDNAMNDNKEVLLDTGISFKNYYVVSYDANGGIGAPAEQYKYHNVSLTISSTKPTRVGYEFLGWSTLKTSNKIEYQSGDKFVLNEAILLYAQWKQLHTLPIFTYTGSYELVEDNDTVIASGKNSKVVIPTKYQTYTGNWKIRFLTTGTLTFHELRSASNGIDVFLVGGGGNGGGSYAYGAGYNGYAGGGGGGGGGYRTTTKNVMVSLSSYKITVGGAEQATSFVLSSSNTIQARGGANGNKPTELNCCESTCAGKGGNGGANGGMGQVNICYNNDSILNGANGGLEFDDKIYTTRYGGGGGGGHGHNGGIPEVGKGGNGGSGGGGSGNREYYGKNTHNGKANTGGGGGGASYVLSKTSYPNYFGDINSSAQSQLSGKSYSAGKGGTGIAIIRNKR